MPFAALLAAVNERIDAGRIPGAAIWIERHGVPLLSAALGLRDPQRAVPMTTDTIFRIYSMTKPIVSVAVMMQVERGLLSLDEPVRTVLPEFANMSVGLERTDAAGVRVLERVAARRDMTIRDLLRHTSGLTYGIFETSLIKDEYIKSGVESRGITNQVLIEKLAALPLVFEPGTEWEYGRSTDLLGALLERLTGQTLGAHLEEHIFSVLGMHETGFSVPGQQQARVAQPFVHDPDNGQAIRLLDPTRPPAFESGGGGLMSTIADYRRFQRMLMGLGSVGPVTLLQPDTVKLMTRDHLHDIKRGAFYLPGPDCGFGLGFAVRSVDGPRGHAGSYYWSGLAGTHQWIDPAADLNVIWMMAAPNQRHEMSELVERHVYQALKC